jgi:hypothetical protein
MRFKILTGEHPAKVCVSFATHGHAFWQRPHTLLATFDTMAWAMVAPSPVSRTV